MGLTALYVLDPATNALFPRCPFHALTGWLCPGCGSQRALHQLLHLNIAAAFALNPLMVVALPYVLIGFILEVLRSRTSRGARLREHWFGGRVPLVWLVVIMVFWIGRNVASSTFS